MYLQDDWLYNYQPDEDIYFTDAQPLMDAEAPLIEVEKDYTGRLMVQQEEYKITFFTPIDILFGIIQGGLNTLPKDGDLSKCGNDSSVARSYMNDMIGDWEGRNFEQFIDNFALFMYMINDTTQHCYLGARDWRENETVDIFDPMQILKNIGFNIGYIWTDIVMLILAKPSNTSNDYFYFVSFYSGDLIFRFFVASNTDENCWYPWACVDSDEEEDSDDDDDSDSD